MKAYLTVHGLASTIVGASRAKAPASASSAAGVKMEVADATDKEKIAYARIMMCLDDERVMMMQTVADGDAAGLWANLVRLYERSSTASKAHTRKMLHASRMGGDDFDVVTGGRDIDHIYDRCYRWC